MRKYANIIAEAETQQLDEGVMDSIRQMYAKAKSMPGFAQAYKTAEQYKDKLTQILKSSKSGKEVIEQIKNLSASVPVTESTMFTANDAVQGVATATGMGSFMTMFVASMSPVFDKFTGLGTFGVTGGAIPVMIVSALVLCLSLWLLLKTNR